MILGPYNRILLLGGGPLLRKICVWAKETGYPISVITAPRHAEEQFEGASLTDFLTAHSVEFIVTTSIDSADVSEFVGDASSAFMLSLGAAWIIDQKTIAKTFANRLLNLHGTRLPQNRGGGGFSWQIMMGVRIGYWTLHVIDGGIDMGDILLTEEFLYPAACRTPADYDRYSVEINFRHLTEFLLETRQSGKVVNPIAQNKFFATYWPRLHTPSDGWIEWSMPAADLERFICAFDEPYSGAQTTLLIDGVERVIRLKGASLTFQDGTFHSYQSGLIYRKSKNWLCVCAKDAGLIIESVRDETGQDVFKNIRVGDRLFTPASKFENLRHRTVYTDSGVCNFSLPNEHRDEPRGESPPISPLASVHASPVSMRKFSEP